MSADLTRKLTELGMAPELAKVVAAAITEAATNKSSPAATGVVKQVNDQHPDAIGKVTLTAGEIGAMGSINTDFTPDADGNVDLAASNVGAVASVHNKAPDDKGNVALTAGDLGAVASINDKIKPDAKGNVTLTYHDVEAASKADGDAGSGASRLLEAMHAALATLKNQKPSGATADEVLTALLAEPKALAK